MSELPEDPIRAHASPFAGLALASQEDLVAVGGSLEPELVLDAYQNAVFPWYEGGEPVLWWSPDPRTILPLAEGALHVPRRLARTLRGTDLEIRVDTAFEAVMRACDESRPDGCWIHEEMIVCYARLHRAGHAHSLEVWRHGALVGGIYGIAFGQVFAAESMFHRERDMSKIALVRLVEHLRAGGYGLLDVQFTTPHLQQFGVIEVDRKNYVTQVTALRSRTGTWGRTFCPQPRGA